MRPSKFVIGVCIVLFVMVFVACNAATPAPQSNSPRIEPTVTLPPQPALRPEYVAEGERVYTRHCAACHGVNLQGQPDWKKPLANGKYPAPPHDDSGHTWHHSDHLLHSIVLNGGLGDGDMSHGDMPAFKDLLSEREVVAVLEFIKSRWSAQNREYQWRMTVEHQ